MDNLAKVLEDDAKFMVFVKWNYTLEKKIGVV